MGDHGRCKNRNAIKSFLRFTHSLCKRHVPHTTNFHKLINLGISGGGKDLEESVRREAKNASYTSSDTITNLVEAIGVWVDELLVYQLLDAPPFQSNG